MEERQVMREDVPRLSRDRPMPGGRTLQDVAREIVNISAAVLTARARLNGSGDNESGYLDTLQVIVASGKVPAPRLLDHHHGALAADLRHVYDDASFCSALVTLPVDTLPHLPSSPLCSPASTGAQVHPRPSR